METKKSFKLKKKHNNNRNEIMCKKGRWLTIRKVLSSYENWFKDGTFTYNAK